MKAIPLISSRLISQPFSAPWTARQKEERNKRNENNCKECSCLGVSNCRLPYIYTWYIEYIYSTYEYKYINARFSWLGQINFPSLSSSLLDKVATNYFEVLFVQLYSLCETDIPFSKHRLQGICNKSNNRKIFTLGNAADKMRINNQVGGYRRHRRRHCSCSCSRSRTACCCGCTRSNHQHQQQQQQQQTATT